MKRKPKVKLRNHQVVQAFTVGNWDRQAKENAQEKAEAPTGVFRALRQRRARRARRVRARLALEERNAD